MHQAGGETPLSRLGAPKSKPVDTTWCPRPPGQTRMKYDGTSSWGVNPHLTAKLGARERDWGYARRCISWADKQIAGAVD